MLWLPSLLCGLGVEVVLSSAEPLRVDFVKQSDRSGALQQRYVDLQITNELDLQVCHVSSLRSDVLGIDLLLALCRELDDRHAAAIVFLSDRYW